ncbi:acyltransferase family protein [Sphingomonas hylomeconis]|uniref:Acyltransferase family protein n=1 Tax=Sphingomonas hylomeconis TaxID=1395958 RepID=A0ABV7SP62_9SPHN|nr:acyltransferase family protein [Sphingomonas hylomeconis]
MVPPTPSSAADAPSQRHYGLDWLRIAAFGLLIFYHIAMVFAPWDWVVKSPQTYPALIVPMALLTPWRLPLLFAVSGYASAKLFDRSGSVRGFARSRTLRLGVPWAFAMLVLIPPEMWVRVREHGYPFGVGHFWFLDAWHRGIFYSIEFPSWEHLWFVVYLWAYTMVLAGLLLGAGGKRLQQGCDWLAGGRRLLWAPIALLVAAKLALLFVVPERQGLFTDWAGHAEYLPIFLFGFALGRSTALWPAIHRAWKPAAAIAVAAGGIVVAMELRYQAHDVPPHAVMALDRAARLAMAWSMIVLLLHVAERYWNHDHRWRATLAEAVFPFYLVHHPVIVLLAWFTLPLGFGPWSEFALLFAGTAAACLIFYLAGRRIVWLRPLIGLRPRARDAKTVRDSAGLHPA